MRMDSSGRTFRTDIDGSELTEVKRQLEAQRGEIDSLKAQLAARKDGKPTNPVEERKRLLEERLRELWAQPMDHASRQRAMTVVGRCEEMQREDHIAHAPEAELSPRERFIRRMRNAWKEPL